MDSKTNIKPVKEDLKQCEKLRDEYLAGWQRTKADFENYKKEEANRFERALLLGREDWLAKVLTVFDSLEAAKEHLPEELKDSEWAQGVLLIESQFENILKEDGIEVINPLGEKFNPQCHEAIGQAEEKGIEPGKVLAVLKKGYRLNGRVLRPAKVKVNK